MDDAKLLKLINNPDTLEEGFRTLMSATQERLYWHIRRMVGNHEDADDVLQNTYIKVHQHIGKFNGESSLFTWMYRIATNESINHLNKQKRLQAMQNGVADSLKTATMASIQDANAEEIKARLDAAVERLPEKQKLVFELRYYQEMPYKEMSEKLHTSVGGLKALFHHAVKKVEQFVLETAL